MTRIHLRPHVSYGLIGSKPVFLDLARDRYVVLPPPLEKTFLDLLAVHAPDAPPEAEGRTLLPTGLFRTGRWGGGLGAAESPAPLASILDEPDRPRASLRDAVRAWRSLRRAHMQLSDRPLLEIVTELREARRASLPSTNPSVIGDFARAFMAARLLVPTERRCLPDSLAMIDWLGESWSQVSLVFGVRLNPFSAHCWLQSESLLLTDAADDLHGFAPVLVV